MTTQLNNPLPSWPASRQLLSMQTWFGAAFPTGAFSFSHGLEAAIAQRQVDDSASLREWLEAALRFGSGRNDCLLMLASACAAEPVGQDSLSGETLQDAEQALAYCNSMALAIATAKERQFETVVQGDAFIQAVSAGRSACVSTSAFDLLPDNGVALPVAVGVAAACYTMQRHSVALYSLNSFISNLVWIAARLLPLGQQAAVQVIDQLAEPVVAVADDALSVAQEAMTVSASRVNQCENLLANLGGCALLVDIAAMQHETLHTRLCQS